MIQILVVEDDFNTRKLMEAVLLDAQFTPVLARDGQEALEILDTQHIDLMITDIMMPEVDGYALVEQLRDADYQLPILMVTAKEAIKDRKKGFFVGTDDYMVKPVDEEEMILRINALLRRAKIVNERKLTVGKVTLNYDTLTVTREMNRVTLPQKEFYLLYKLLSYPNMIFTRVQLMDEIWGMDSETSEHTVSVHIGRLREKFYDWPDFDIITVRGLGYKAVQYDEE
ncbi:response regulator transcription factor [Breznakia pachnodae]|uniref:Heme response regulator HssR n=1 Tax=Breznakia pachnodae TaxID=265178 RepID=A0ABU0DXR3_9FIRM|nr:response regulator transcription factor [Breznakia pachnodae]MDQ0359429.1 DNA-binding response OmpR family regulator [Breznakia pachnodae]